MKKKEKLNYTVSILFLVYLALLIWIILFKLQFSILDLDQVREINLIPFYYEHEVTFHATEVLENVLIFMPFGIYLCLLFPKGRFSVKLLLISMVSLLLEICQYVLSKLMGHKSVATTFEIYCGIMEAKKEIAKTIDSVMDPAIDAVKVRSKGGIVCM